MLTDAMEKWRYPIHILVGAFAEDTSLHLCHLLNTHLPSPLLSNHNSPSHHFHSQYNPYIVDIRMSSLTHHPFITQTTYTAIYKATLCVTNPVRCTAGYNNIPTHKKLQNLQPRTVRMFHNVALCISSRVLHMQCVGCKYQVWNRATILMRDCWCCVARVAEKGKNSTQ